MARYVVGCWLWCGCGTCQLTQVHTHTLQGTKNGTGVCKCEPHYHGENCTLCDMKDWGTTLSRCSAVRALPIDHLHLLLVDRHPDCPGGTLNTCNGHGSCICTGPMPVNTTCNCDSNFIGNDCSTCNPVYRYGQAATQAATTWRVLSTSSPSYCACGDDFSELHLVAHCVAPVTLGSTATLPRRVSCQSASLAPCVAPMVLPTALAPTMAPTRTRPCPSRQHCTCS